MKSLLIICISWLAFAARVSKVNNATSINNQKAVQSTASNAKKPSTCSSFTYRKEASDMTDDDWRVYTDTIKKAVSRGIWQKAVKMHNGLKNTVHWNSIFLLWHRAYIRDVEKKLQEINPAFFFPWLEEADWEEQDVKAFPQTKLYLRSQEAASPSRKWEYSYNHMSTLQLRKYTDDSIKSGGFSAWTQDIEIEHGNFHINVGGDMETMQSPKDPLFYSHHSYIDYIWSKAQIEWGDKVSQIGGPLKGGKELTMSTRVPKFGYTFDQISSPEKLCVRYVPKKGNPLVFAASAAPSQNIANTPKSTTKPKKLRKCPNVLPKSWLEMNGIPHEAAAKVNKKCLSILQENK